MYSATYLAFSLSVAQTSGLKAAFHDTDIDNDTDTNILAMILADTSDTRDFLARILARMSVSVNYMCFACFLANQHTCTVFN